MNLSKMACRRTRLSFKEKSEICELSLQANFDKEKIMDKYGIRKSCLYNTLKQKDSILKMKISKQSGNFKKFSKSKNDDLDTKLVQWVHSKNEMGMVPGGEHITTAQFVKNLQSVRSYLQSRGADEQIYNLLHELDIIAL